MQGVGVGEEHGSVADAADICYRTLCREEVEC